MSNQAHGVKIKPRLKNPDIVHPTKVETLEGLKDLPEFEKLNDSQWTAIYTMWDIAATKGRKASMTEIADIVGVAVNTVKRWRCREDFLRASELVKMLVLHEWEPILLNKAISMAVGGDKQMLKMFMEHILPNKQANKEQPDTEINISWGENTPETKNEENS